MDAEPGPPRPHGSDRREDGSPLIEPDGTGPPADAASLYLPTATPGGRAPHAWLADGRSLYDCLGFDFVLLRLGTKAPAATSWADAAGRARVPLRVVDIAADEVRDLYGADLVLLRPDQIVAWRGNRPPADPVSLLARLTGQEG